MRAHTHTHIHTHTYTHTRACGVVYDVGYSHSLPSPPQALAEKERNKKWWQV